jgi:solute carrier family 66 (lysosomal lysine-arginine transporter), member 1
MIPAMYLMDEPMANMTNGIHNCTGGIEWIFTILGMCVVDTRMLLAVICSIISMFAWISYGLPQMVENCRTGLADKAVSPFLLIFWTTGDTCNIVGAILMNQLVMMKVIAAYCIFCDIVLSIQFIYCYIKHKRKTTYLYVNFNEDASDSISVREPLTNSLQSNISEGPTRLYMWSGIGVISLSISLLYWFSTGLSESPTLLSDAILGSRHVPGFKSRELLSVKPHIPPLLKDLPDIAGYVLGCVSSVFYLAARVPQLLQNRRRQSTEGLSIFVFLLAILGNITYSLQIFLTSTDKRWLLRALPWIIGSLGVLSLDVVMMFQFFNYRNNRSPDDASENSDPETDSLDDTRPLTYS